MTIKTLLESAQNSLTLFPAFPLQEGPKSAQSGLALTLPTLYFGSICLRNRGRRGPYAHVCSCVSPSCSHRYQPGRTAHLNSVLTPLTCAATRMPHVPDARGTCVHAARHYLSSSHLRLHITPLERGASRSVVCARVSRATQAWNRPSRCARKRATVLPRSALKGGPLISVHTSEVHP
jgi:hypothetical protein